MSTELVVETGIIAALIIGSALGVLAIVTLISIRSPLVRSLTLHRAGFRSPVRRVRRGGNWHWADLRNLRTASEHPDDATKSAKRTGPRGAAGKPVPSIFGLVIVTYYKY